MPKRAAIILSLFCCMAPHAHAAHFEASVKTPAGQAVENAAVVLDPVNGKAPSSRNRERIEQRDREFVPYLTIVQKGTTVDFPNRDKIKHHVYSFSPAKTFELKLYGGEQARPVTFDQLGEIALGCNIHDWMEAHVLVVDTPWFAKTGAKGLAGIPSVPPGFYRLRLWHPQQKTAAENRVIEITKAGTVRLDLTLDIAPRVLHPKPPADYGEY